MPELIDRQASIKAICDGCFKSRAVDIELKCRGTCNVIDILQQQPTIDAEPVKHSAWTVHDPDFNSYQCKNCGLAWMLNDGNPAENEMNYCPKCGARMDGGAENG